MKKDKLDKTARAARLLDNEFENLEIWFSGNSKPTFQFSCEGTKVILAMVSGKVRRETSTGWKTLKTYWSKKEWDDYSVTSVANRLSAEIIPFIKESITPETCLQKFDKIKKEIEEKCEELFEGVRKRFIKFDLNVKYERITIVFRSFGGTGMTSGKMDSIHKDFDDFFDDERFNKYDLFSEVNSNET